MTPVIAENPTLCSYTVELTDVERSQPLVAKGARLATLQWLNSEGYDKIAKRRGNCGMNAVRLKCPNGHTKYVKIHCGLDFCSECGKVGSAAHKKRYIPALDKLIHLGVLGYLTLTIPKEISEAWPNRDALRYLVKHALQIVADNFPQEGGFIRTHFFGEEGHEPHVHFNVLFPIVNESGKGEVPQEVLDRIREQWSKVINDYFGTDLKTTNIKYLFAVDVRGRIKHIRYVLRATATRDKFLMSSDNTKHWIMSLVGWHNTRWFGKLADRKCREYLESKDINPTERQDKDVGLSMVCPKCGEKFKSAGIISWSELPRSQLRCVDDESSVDFEIWEAIKEKERYKVFDSGLSFKDIVKQFE